MDTKRIDTFKEFAAYIEYPMVVFEAESGKVLDINYEAEIILGKDVKNISIEPGRAFTKTDFWNSLRTKKSLMWHRIRMEADGNTHLVSGLINQAVAGDKLIYTVLFELRADMNIGSLTLERIVDHAGIVAMNISVGENGKKHVEYVSQNINQYGYTRVQLYDKGMDVDELVCPEDFEGLQEQIRHDISRHIEENAIECRLLTEERELIPVRILFHYNYDDIGNLTDYEVLALDRKEELRKSDENQYLSNAMFKMKSVVIVKSYHAGKRNLKYISSNAGMLGMNVEALQKGYKLSEDYIHPEDRDAVVDAIYKAVANGVSDYEHRYRMVRDDGKQIWVDNQVTVNRISDGEAEISFLLTDISEQKELENELAAMANSGERKSSDKRESDSGKKIPEYGELALAGQLQIMADGIGKDSEFYSVGIDAFGNLITNPVGPAENIGLFYDLFERPELKGRLDELFEQIQLQMTSKSLDINLDGMSMHLIFEPLMVEGEIKAYWVLVGIAGSALDKMGDVADSQWRLANMLVESFYANGRIEQEVKNRKMTEFKLEREKQERRMVRELLDIAMKGNEAGLSEMCQKISLHLSVSYIGIYVENKETGNAEKYFVWNQKDENYGFFDLIELTASEINEVNKLLGEGKYLSATKGETEPFLKELIRKTRTKMLTLYTMTPGFGQWGYIVFADETREQDFDKKELHFIDTISKLIQTVVFRNKTVIKADLLREGFLETYDHIKDAVFVKDNLTGEIVFANKTMDKLFGYSIVGMQAQDIINDQMEQYRMIQGMRKRFIANNKVTKWQSYMKELDQIMNIVEISLNVFSDADLSLVILKKNKNK